MADAIHHAIEHRLYTETLDRVLWTAVLIGLTITAGGMFVGSF